MAQGKEKSSRYAMMKFLEKADRFLKAGADAFETIAKFQEKPTVAGAIHMGTKLTREALGTSFFNCYRPGHWNCFFPGDDHFKGLVELLSHFPRKSYGDKKEDLINFYDLYGRTLAHEAISSNYFRYLEEETDQEELHRLLARAVWDTCGSPCVMRTRTNTSHSSWLSTVFEYAPSPTPKTFKSGVCNDIMERLKLFLDHDISRSAMLNGPPGTGKTTIINAVAAAFGEKVLVVDVADLHYCSSTTLAKRVRWLQPNVLVINDLDRFSNSSQMLNALEEMHDILKLLLVSVNDKNQLPPAVRRPGRFDEIFEVRHLDEPVVMDILGVRRDMVPDAIYEEVRLWPAAFIDELSKRIRCLGPECLVREFCSLKERVKENEKDDEDDEDDDDKESKKKKTAKGPDKK